VWFLAVHELADSNMTQDMMCDMALATAASNEIPHVSVEVVTGSHSLCRTCARRDAIVGWSDDFNLALEQIHHAPEIVPGARIGETRWTGDEGWDRSSAVGSSVSGHVIRRHLSQNNM
jgi:hypothetical protein